MKDCELLEVKAFYYQKASEDENAIQYTKVMYQTRGDE